MWSLINGISKSDQVYKISNRAENEDGHLIMFHHVEANIYTYNFYYHPTELIIINSTSILNDFILILLR